MKGLRGEFHPQGKYSTSFIQGDPIPRFKPLPLHKPFLAEKVTISYTVQRKWHLFCILTVHFYRPEKCPAEIFLPKKGPPENLYPKTSSNPEQNNIKKKISILRNTQFMCHLHSSFTTATQGTNHKDPRDHFRNTYELIHN